jgi:hypothetical protein
VQLSCAFVHSLLAPRVARVCFPPVYKYNSTIINYSTSCVKRCISNAETGNFLRDAERKQRDNVRSANGPPRARIAMLPACRAAAVAAATCPPCRGRVLPVSIAPSHAARSLPHKGRRERREVCVSADSCVCRPLRALSLTSLTPLPRNIDLCSLSFTLISQ